MNLISLCHKSNIIYLHLQFIIHLIISFWNCHREPIPSNWQIFNYNESFIKSIYCNCSDNADALQNLSNQICHNLLDYLPRQFNKQWYWYNAEQFNPDEQYTHKKNNTQLQKSLPVCMQHTKIYLHLITLSRGLKTISFVWKFFIHMIGVSWRLCYIVTFFIIFYNFIIDLCWKNNSKLFILLLCINFSTKSLIAII